MFDVVVCLLVVVVAEVDAGFCMFEVVVVFVPDVALTFKFLKSPPPLGEPVALEGGGGLYSVKLPNSPPSFEGFFSNGGESSSSSPYLCLTSLLVTLSLM